MEEEDLQSSIETYKQQLAHVEQAIQAAGSTPDLDTLKTDLEELIKLTEESLLSLRKSQLLKQLDRDSDVSTTGPSSQSVASNSLDDEYAAFQAMLGGDSDAKSADNIEYQHSHRMDAESDPISRGVNSNIAKGDNLDNDNCNTQSVSDLYKDIIGTKCRAPYVHEWGAKTYSNALIASLECDSDLEIPKVRVMYCNPTHLSMLPCKYYLNGSCRFSQDDCRFSHGHIVDLEELQEYKEPVFSSLKLESRCLARYDHDDLWYKATVVDLHDDNVKVTFDTYDDEPVTLQYEDIFPSDETDQASSDSDDDYQPMKKEDSDDEDDLPVYLWKPPSHGLGDLGQWEAHTKGIGSRLLTKMGYVPGQGLGKSGEGRIQPVPIQLLPQGKSLDKIMMLKERAGEQDMFDVMKKQEKKMKKQVEKLEQQYHKSQTKPDVFDFINKKLHGKKGKLSELIHKHGDASEAGSGQGKLQRTISEHDLKSKSDRNINIQLLKTGEEMKSVEKQLIKLKQSLSRNENRDRNMATQVRQKIQWLESYLDKLKSSESTMQIHQQKRSDHKKLTVF